MRASRAVDNPPVLTENSPSPKELSSPVYSFQLVGKGKLMRAVPAPRW
jgi:hypothetical protein